MELQVTERKLSELSRIEDFRISLAVWDDLRGDRFAPPWRTTDLLRLPSRVIPYIAVADVLRDPEDYVYRFWGTGHFDVKGEDLTGCSVRCQKPPALGQILFSEYQLVVARRSPQAFRHDLRPDPDRASLWQETLRLPLSADGVNVTQVLSFADWRTRAENWKELFDDVAAR